MIRGQRELEQKQKRSVLACLQSDPDFSGLRDFAEQPSDDSHKLLQWIDESGLAIYLLRQISTRNRFDDLNPWFRTALSAREEANRNRTKLMLAEFARINEALRRTAVDYAVVKGFSLAGDFCSDPWVRHQCDTDLLVAPESVLSATSALQPLGYKVESVDASGEICLAIRSKHVPSSEDFLYSEPPHWHVDIHPYFYEPIWGVSFRVGTDWTHHLEWGQVEGIEFPRLNRKYRFLGQVLHAFRHISAWVRLSWLYEIAYFAERFHDDEALWADLEEITHADVKLRNACGVVCSMVRDTFGTTFHQVIQGMWIDPLTLRQQIWVSRYAPQMLLNDFTSGDKVGLLLQRSFADSSWAWWKSRLNRYLKSVQSIGKEQQDGPLFIIERARRHVSYLCRSLLWNLEVKRDELREHHER